MRRFFNQLDSRGLRRQLRREATDAEAFFWIFVRNRRFFGLKFYRQFGIDRFIVDFFCLEKRLAIELDGSYHREDEQMRLDEQRTRFLEENGIQVLRFWNGEVLTNQKDVFDRIRSVIELPERPLPPLSKRGF